MLIRQVVGHSYGHNWHHISHCGAPCAFLWHYHPEFELTLTRHSHGTRYVGSDVQAFGELDLVLVAPNCAHTWHNDEDSANGHEQLQVVFFTLEWLQALAAAGLPELHAVNHWLAGVRQGVVFSPRLIEQLLPLFDRLEATRGLERAAVLLQIFDALSHDGEARYLGAHITTSAGGGSDRRVEAALAHLQQNYRVVVSLNSIAAATPAICSFPPNCRSTVSLPTAASTIWGISSASFPSSAAARRPSSDVKTGCRKSRMRCTPMNTAIQRWPAV